jgi:hypothetical protein
MEGSREQPKTLPVQQAEMRAVAQYLESQHY